MPASADACAWAVAVYSRAAESWQAVDVVCEAAAARVDLPAAALSAEPALVRMLARDTYGNPLLRSAASPDPDWELLVTQVSGSGCSAAAFIEATRVLPLPLGDVILAFPASAVACTAAVALASRQLGVTINVTVALPGDGCDRGDAPCVTAAGTLQSLAATRTASSSCTAGAICIVRADLFNAGFSTSILRHGSAWAVRLEDGGAVPLAVSLDGSILTANFVPERAGVYSIRSMLAVGTPPFPAIFDPTHPINVVAAAPAGARSTLIGPPRQSLALADAVALTYIPVDRFGNVMTVSNSTAALARLRLYAAGEATNAKPCLCAGAACFALCFDWTTPMAAVSTRSLVGNLSWLPLVQQQELPVATAGGLLMLTSESPPSGATPLSFELASWTVHPGASAMLVATFDERAVPGMRRSWKLAGLINSTGPPATLGGEQLIALAFTDSYGNGVGVLPPRDGDGGTTTANVSCGGLAATAEMLWPAAWGGGSNAARNALRLPAAFVWQVYSRLGNGSAGAPCTISVAVSEGGAGAVAEASLQLPAYTASASCLTQLVVAPSSSTDFRVILGPTGMPIPLQSLAEPLRMALAATDALGVRPPEDCARVPMVALPVLVFDAPPPARAAVVLQSCYAADVTMPSSGLFALAWIWSSSCALPPEVQIFAAVGNAAAVSVIDDGLGWPQQAVPASLAIMPGGSAYGEVLAAVPASALLALAVSGAEPATCMASSSCIDIDVNVTCGNIEAGSQLSAVWLRVAAPSEGVWQAIIDVTAHQTAVGSTLCLLVCSASGLAPCARTAVDVVLAWDAGAQVVGPPSTSAALQAWPPCAHTSADIGGCAFPYSLADAYGNEATWSSALTSVMWLSGNGSEQEEQPWLIARATAPVASSSQVLLFPQIRPVLVRAALTAQQPQPPTIAFATPVPSASTSVTISSSASVSPQASVSATARSTQSASQSGSASASATLSDSSSGTASTSATSSPSASGTATASATPSSSATLSGSLSVSASETGSGSSTASTSATSSLSVSATATASMTPSSSATLSSSMSIAASQTATNSASSTAERSRSSSLSQSGLPSASLTRSVSRSSSLAPTGSGSVWLTASATTSTSGSAALSLPCARST